MNSEFIRSVITRQPFQAFEVRMSNGDVHIVTHPENVWLAGSRLLIYEPATDRLAICSLLHITGIHMLQAA